MTTTELLANLTPRFAATWMNGREYRKEFPSNFFLDELRRSRTVVAYGASDDLVEFDGAIYDEFGAGGKIYVTADGVPANACPEGEDCPNYVLDKKYWVEALWSEPGAVATWTFLTNIPGATRFMIMDDGEAYCEGLAFSLDDLK